MASIFYRGDDRTFNDITLAGGFKPRDLNCVNRTQNDAINYIKDLISKNSWNKVDFVQAVVVSSKPYCVSTSRIIGGASYGTNKYQIVYQADPLYFDFNNDGSLGDQLLDLGNMAGRKPYYILTHSSPALSAYVAVGTRTVTQEATFFTDIPIDTIQILPQ